MPYRHAKCEIMKRDEKVISLLPMHDEVKTIVGQCYML